MSPKLFVLLLSVGSAMGLANTGTATGGEVPQVAVSYQGLDLSRPADAQTMYARLQRAASAVCEPVPAAELARHRVWEQCYRASLERAVNQIDAPQVLARYRADPTSSSRRG